MSECKLCGLQTPKDPVTDSGIEGEFCCRGCLEVTRYMGEVEEFDISEDRIKDNQKIEDGSEIPENSDTVYFSVEGLHCSACEIFIEKKAKEKKGVIDVDVSYTSETAKIIYDPSIVDRSGLPSVIERLGYNVQFLDKNRQKTDFSSDFTDSSHVLVGSILGMIVMLMYGVFLYPSYMDFSPMMKMGVLIVSLVLGMAYCGVAFILLYDIIRGLFLLVILQGFALIVIFSSNILTASLVLSIVLLSASIVVFYTGYPFFKGAYISLVGGYPTMDLLITLAVFAAYSYSVIMYFLGSIEVYFDIAVMIVLVVTLGNKVENRIKKSALDRVSEFTDNTNTDVNRRLPDGGIESVRVENIDPYDEVVVGPGERIPLDGEIIEGSATVDESLITGESIPETKKPGDVVKGGTMVSDNTIIINVGENTESTIDRLVELVWNIQTSSSSIQQFADDIAGIFVPLVVLIAFLTSIYYLLSGTVFSLAILTGVAVLVVSCPCAFGLATPLAVTGGIREILDEGIIIRDVSLFERIKDVDIVVFDKTGTLTTGEFTVLDTVTAKSSHETLIKKAAMIEQFSNHPVADAIYDYSDNIPRNVVSNIENKTQGISGTVDGSKIQVGNFNLFETKNWKFPDELKKQYHMANSSHNSPVIVGWDGLVRGIIIVGDKPRKDSTSVIEKLSNMEKKIIVLTGDDKVNDIFKENSGIDCIFSGVPPEGKVQTIRNFRKEGTVAMVGDGTNDAPALASSDLGIAMESGTDITTDTADATIISNELSSVPKLFNLTNKTRTRIWQNLGWAATYNIVAIPLAITTVLNPLFAAIAMAASSLIVVGNSTRKLN